VTPARNAPSHACHPDQGSAENPARAIVLAEDLALVLGQEHMTGIAARQQREQLDEAAPSRAQRRKRRIPHADV